MKPTTPHTRRHMLALGLAALGGAAIAQEAPPAPPASGASGPGRARRFQGGKLKEQLKLTEAQEAAWKQFTDAMHPPAPPAPQERVDWSKLTTPQRLDRMQELADKHHAAMRQRHDAIRTFYAQLTPEQQKIFDDFHARRPPFGRGKHPGKRGPRHGTPGGPPPRESK
ncbi:MAG: Spy/CpxP family protein refolding chaperone [Ottowia sp.]|nr:Spy/CpxP family protein refolding chaperone [Ottowia sp.]